MTEFSHYSKSAALVPYSVEQVTGTLKPHGLWLSVDGDDDWPAWCRDNDFDDIDSKNRYRVEIADGPLVLSTADEILDFQREHGHHDYGYQQMDWTRVATRWPGIIIAPYQWSIRMDGPLWYYGWDCASGCVWDADVITSVEPVPAEAATP